MKWLDFVVFLTIGLIVLNGCADKEEEIKPKERGGIIQYEAGPNFQGNTIPIHYFIPAGNPDTMPFQIVLHGANRNANGYLAAWAQKAREYGVIVIAPEFKTTDFNNVQYNEGNFIVSGSINSPESTTFSLLDRIFEFTKDSFRLENTGYNLYGHSAGAQFVHRFLQFHESPYVQKSIAANAGWYTFPDPNSNYPYGISGLFPDVNTLHSSYYQKELILLLGTADTLRDNSLRVTTAADRQGLNRFERGENFFEFNAMEAGAGLHNFNWQKQVVEGVGHDHTLMSPAAADFLYKK